MVKQRKIDWVDQLTSDLREHPDLVFTDFHGLNVEEMEALRRQLHEQKSRLKVVKNSLAERAFERFFAEAASPAPAEETQAVDLELSDLSGVGEATVEALGEAGIDSVQQLLESSPDELTRVKGIGPATAESLLEEARQALGEAGGTPSGAAEPDPPDSMDQIRELLTGNTALTLSGNGFEQTAKTLIEFSEEHEDLRIKGGLLRGEVLDLQTVERIAELPSRRELLTRLAQDLNSSLVRLVRALRYPLQKLAFVLEQVKHTREQTDKE